MIHTPVTPRDRDTQTDRDKEKEAKNTIYTIDGSKSTVESHPG